MSIFRAKQPANQDPTNRKLAVFRYAGSTPFIEGLALCKREKRVMASNMMVCLALLSNRESLDNMAFPSWTGTMTAYVEPDRAFREAAEKIASFGNNYFLIYTDPKSDKRWFFPVPQEHLDKKNAILVAESRDYVIDVDSTSRIVWPKKVDAIEKFPAQSSFGPGDREHDIPNMGEPDSNHNIRELVRTKARVGPVATDFGRPSTIDLRRLYLDLPPSTPLGIIVEAQ